FRRAPAGIEMIWIIEVDHVPITLVCVRIIVSGVAVGTPVATVDCSNTGIPPAVTRTAPTSHGAVTQGPLPPWGTNGQPVIRCGRAMGATGLPLTVTRANGTIGCACPPWAHITKAFE